MTRKTDLSSWKMCMQDLQRPKGIPVTKGSAGMWVLHVRWKWDSKWDVRMWWCLLICNLDDHRQDGRGGGQKADELSVAEDRTNSFCLVEEAEKSAVYNYWWFNPGLRERSGNNVLQHNQFYQSLYKGPFEGVLHWYHGTIIFQGNNFYALDLNSYQMGLQ